MKLSSRDLIKLTALAVKAAKLAGALIVEKSGDVLTVNNKESGVSKASQVFTEVDLASQEIILSKLSNSVMEYDLGILSEEGIDDQSRFVKDYFWCIDPLDGTLPFIERTDGYSVSIALVSRSGEALIGVVFDPLHGDCFSACRGQGAFHNGKKISVTSVESPLTFVTDRSFAGNKWFAASLSVLAKKSKEPVITRTYGGAVMNACWVLSNQPACYFKFPKKARGGGSVWDYAATVCIFTEVGGYVSDMYRNPLELNSSNTTFMNEGGVLFASSRKLAEEVLNFFECSGYKT